MKRFGNGEKVEDNKLEGRRGKEKGRREDGTLNKGGGMKYGRKKKT